MGLSGEAMLLKESSSSLGNPDNVAVGLDQPSISCVFPDWQFGAGRSPSIDRVVIAAVLLCHPFKQVKNQVLHDKISHIRIFP